MASKRTSFQRINGDEPLSRMRRAAWLAGGMVFERLPRTTCPLMRRRRAYSATFSGRASRARAPRSTRRLAEAIAEDAAAPAISLRDASFVALVIATRSGEHLFD